MDKAALLVFSGGQDSTTCLAWALNRYERVTTVGFAYGQRHAVEMECRSAILNRLRQDGVDAQDLPGGWPSVWKSRLGEDTVLDLGVLAQIGGTSLTDDMAIAMQANGLPNSFVPGRNLLFLTAAAALAYRQGADHIVTGVGEADYSGYPDCRDNTIRALETAINLGTEHRFSLLTPLMHSDKAATWELARAEGGDAFVELVRTMTHTCYEGDHVSQHDWGHGCGHCPACVLRARGWEAFARACIHA